MASAASGESTPETTENRRASFKSLKTGIWTTYDKTTKPAEEPPSPSTPTSPKSPEKARSPFGSALNLGKKSSFFSNSPQTKTPRTPVVEKLAHIEKGISNRKEGIPW